MADLVMRKRPAMHAGEMGLFIDAIVFEDEFASIKQNTDVTVTATQSRNVKQMRLAWALCRKISESGALGDADTREVMNYLLLKAKHVRYVTNIHRSGTDITPIVKSIRFASMDQTSFDRLFNRMLYIVTSEILSDVPDGQLRDEIEKMAGIATPEPMPETPPKRRGRQPRGKPSMPDPVSIIPDTDPVTAGSVPNFPGQPSPSCRHDGEGQPTNSDPAQEPVTQPMGASPNSPSAEPAPSPVANAERAPIARDSDGRPGPGIVVVSYTPSPELPAERAPITRDLEGWRTYCLAWLEQYRADPEKTELDVMIRWNADRPVRNACGATTEERQPVSEVYLNLVDEKRRKVKSI